MAAKPDPDSTKSAPTEPRKGPGGMTMRELHELVKNSHARDQATEKRHNQLAQPQNRWQRLVRYVWDKNKG